MSYATKTGGAAESALISLRNWPTRVPDGPSKIPSYPEAKTPSSHPSVHLGLRIQKKIIHFDQIIAGFHQRRWS